MILIADSGSTKTHWCLVGGKERRETLTQGLNPHFTNEETMLSVFRSVSDELLDGSSFSGEVYFYGSGCGTEEMKSVVSRTLMQVFADTNVCCVEGDLLGACRAVCGTESGMVGILGTGSNLCYYDGRRIAMQRVSTGYILGDEGSGCHIGKRLLKDYLEGSMPDYISHMFHDAYGYTTQWFLDKLYHQAYPNRFLASLAVFAAQHKDEAYVESVLDDCFGSFFNQLDFFGEDCRKGPLYLVGGLIHVFLPEIRWVSEQKGVLLGNTLADPMEGLVRYHQSGVDSTNLMR